MNSQEQLMTLHPRMVAASLATFLIAITTLGCDRPQPTSHDSNHHPRGDMPVQTGQDAFAAVAEIAEILEGDRATNWEQVDLDALRDHLIDMNQVMLAAAVETREVSGGLEMSVTGEGNAIASIQRLLTAHAAELDRTELLSSSAREIANGVQWTVTSDRPSDISKIRGLGFAGLLVMGSHHQAHHVAIARGLAPHE